MSHPLELLAELNARGLFVEPRGLDRLRVGPPDLVDDETIARIRQVKASLLKVLTEHHGDTWACIRCGRFSFTTPVVCYWCRRAEDMDLHA